MDDNYDLQYFSARNQDKDRPALWFYERLACRWIKPGAVLDYGCGTGFMLLRLGRFYDVSGYDLSPHAREAARINFPGLTVYNNQNDIPESYFSGIVSLHVLEHIEKSELVTVLNKWHRALLPGGRVLCVMPDADGRGHSLAASRWTGFGDLGHVTLMGHRSWSELFTANGFIVNKIGTDGLWCLPYREGRSKFCDGIKYSMPTVIQFLFGRLILAAGSGESAVFLLEKADHED